MLRGKGSNPRETASSIPKSYTDYSLSGEEWTKYYGVAVPALSLLGLLFYRNLIAALLCAAVSFLLSPIYAKYRREERREKLLEGFRDMLYTVSGSVAAGRRMPEAVSDAASQLGISYGKESDIYLELSEMTKIYQSVHGDLSELLIDFGRRSDLPEIKQFASAYAICKKSGGDVEQVSLKSASLLLDRIAFRSELKALISQKKLDIFLLMLMPIAVLLFLNVFSYGYVSVLYETLSGRLIMSFCLAGIAVALLWSLKITEVSI